MSAIKDRIEDIYPLAPLQQGILFHALQAPAAGAYFEQLSWELAGDLDAGAFRRAWQMAVDRHPALRSAFFWDEGDEPFQVVHRRVELPWEELDWSGLAAAEQEERLADLFAADRRRGFDLARPPLVRLVLVRLGERRHRLVWSQHHIVVDGWSLPRILAGVFTGYEAYRANRTPDLPPVRPYRDYIAWLLRQDTAAAEAFWRRALAGFTEPTPLLPDRRPERSLESEDAVGEAGVRLPAALTADLKSLARRGRLTLNTVVSGAWAQLLGRWAGRPEVVFGATLSGRPADLPGAESMVGLFINTLPVRVPLCPDLPVLDGLADLQERQVAVQRFSHSSLAEVQGWSEVPRGEPLFGSILAFESFPAGPAASPGGSSLAILDVRYGGARTGYPLTLLAVPGEDLGLRLFYDRRLFDAPAVRRRLEQMAHLLQGFTACPDARLADVPLLGEAERHQLTREWNDTATDRPREASLAELLTAVASARPDAVALSAGERHLSYGALLSRSRGWARRLRGLGVGPEVVVGLCADRSPETIAALLGIVLAGGAYVPVDPAWPEARQRSLLASARPRVIVAGTGHTGRLADLGAAVLRLEEPVPEAGEEELPEVGPRHLVYVEFTSGSTGEPKPVGVEHGAVVRLVRGASFLRWMPEDVGFQLAPLSFDASTFEIWGPLLAGARLAIAPADALSLAELGDAIRRAGATVLWLTAGLFRQMIEHQLEDLGGLRALLAGGDTVPAGAVERFLAAWPESGLIDGYGPTENTTFTCCGRLEPGGPVTIGRPISNTRAWLLDADLEPVPLGAAGELYAAGEGLARGYLGAPELTAERFVPDPFAEEPGGRLYRTGDLARHLADGRLDFLGRADGQVKLSGFRVETGEVEAALGEHPDVAGCAVDTRLDAAEEKRLIAWVVPRGAAAPSPRMLQDFLRRRLPDFMLPAVFVTLPELPLTPAGKVDRRQLPEPAPAAALPAGPAERPRGPLEELVARLWAEVLELPAVGVETDFFELGGHSLRATQLVSRLRDALGVELPLRDFFDEPTVRGVAGKVQALRRGGPERQAPPLVPVPRHEPLPLSFAQQRLWFLDQLVPGNPFYNMPAALRCTGPLDAAALERALGEIVRRHEILRTTLEAPGGEPVQRIAPGGSLALPRIDLRALGAEAREDEARRLAEREASRCFDLARDRPLRAALVQVADRDHALLVTFHHVAADGWSVGVFTGELAALYAAFRSGEPSPLAELPVQYADFAVWQRRWLREEVLEEHLAYWRGRLGAAPPSLLLPLDRQRPAVARFHGGRRPLALPRVLAEELQALSARSRSTLFMTLLAAWQVQLARYAGQDRIAVGSPIANRNRSETEGLIGFFVNTLVLSADLSGRPAFRDLLEQVREATLGAYDHQDLPFEKLVEELQPERDLSRNPLFQAAFALQNAPAAALDLPDLRLSLLPFEDRTTRVDLELHLQEAPEGLRGLLIWDTGLFDASTIARMVEHWQVLLAGIAADPAARCPDLPLLRPGERHQLLAEWNDTGAPRPGTLPEIFAEAVERAPEAVAAVFVPEGRHLSYAELACRAQRLAARLRRLGVGPESVVGLAVERSPEMLIGLLGISRAGGAFLPLDLEQSPQRLRFIVEDAGLAALVGSVESSDGSVGSVGSVRSVGVEGVEADPEPRREASAITPEHPAYVIYTSGSTGRPKGVLVPHGGLANVAAAQRTAFQAGPGDHIVQFSSPSFDASVFEIVLALGAGATLVLADRASLVPGPALARLLREHEITSLTIPPPLLARLPAGELPALATIVVAGDECSAGLAGLWGPGRRFFDAYGPTETTIWATLARWEGGRPPIGRPIPGTRTHLLDAELRPVPAGVPGELYVGGGGLARGYLGRPDLTAERFVPDPFAAGPGARLYRTGDLARRLADGQLDFLGRADHQVKVRGFRIEPGEIEAALRVHPAVREAAVVAREERDETTGDRRLVAYVAADARAAGEGGQVWEGERIGHWRTLYERTYAEPASPADPAFNLVGWRSSYTGEPLPPEEMREWLEGTVERILALRPRRVLEIGCGSGLLLFRVAPVCELYHGTDFSATALDSIRPHLDRLPDVRVVLEERVADDLAGLPEGSFDTIVLNSVVQYFPGVDYLLRVLDGALRLLAPGGSLFLGDLRSLPLLELFQASVALHRAPEGLPAAEILRRARRGRELEEELALDPAFFAALRARHPRIREVDLRLRRGRHRNELSKFRYDVALRTGETGADREPAWRSWPAEGFPAVRRILAEEAPERLGLARVPNARLAEDLRSLGLLSGSAGADPEDLRTLAAELGYEMAASWSDAGPEGRFDAVFVRRGAGPVVAPSGWAGAAGRERSWASYANQPLLGQLARHLVPDLRRHLQDLLPAHMVPASFVLLEALPLNPSGKVDRQALPAPERDRADVDAAFVAPRTPVEETLAAIWSEVLRRRPIGVHDNFFELGGDSILSIQIVSRARQAGLEITPRQLFQGQTVAALAALIVLPTAAPAPGAEQGPVTGPVPLTPIQQWFFAQGHRRPDHWNQAFLLELRRSVDDAALAGAVAALLEHHDALRHRFLPGEGGWRQVATGPGDLSHSPPPYTRIDLGALPPGRRLDAEEAAAGALQASLDLSGGPLLRCARLGAGEEPGSLLLIVHHLVVDGVSWRILLEDLWTAHEQLRGGGPARLPAKTTSFRAWAERLAEYARSPRLREELPLWRVDASARLAELPFAEGSPAPVSASHTVTVSRSTEETRRLQDLAALYRMGLDEVLLAALARAVQEEAGGALLVAVEGHGREEVFPGVDLSRTVGWFTTLSPVLLDLGGTGDTRSALLRIRERMRRIPDRGLGYGVLRYPGGELDGEPEPAVSFNYLGHLDRLVPGEAPFDLAARGAGPLHDSGTRRSFPLEVGAALFDGQLHVHATCDDRPGHREALERLAERLAAMLSTYAGMSEGADTVEDVYELSPVQQGLLFHALRDPEPGMYFEQLSWTFAGGLRPEVLRRAWQRLLERHPALRASFRWEGLDQPLQMVERSVSLPWEELDWRGLEPREQGRRFEERLRLELERGFELDRAPLLRLLLARTGDRAWRFAWSQHHILMDGWCFPVLMGELFELYAADLNGEAPRLEPARPFHDYIHWLQRQGTRDAETAWREALAGFDEPTPLGVDRPADGRAVGAAGYGEARCTLPVVASAELRALARRRLTLNTAVQGAWALLLAVYAGRDDVVFGATVSGRPAELEGAETMVGLFINTLPVRARVAPMARAEDWLRDLQDRQLHLRQHGHVPLTDIHGWSEVPRDRPLFESLLVFENYPVGEPGAAPPVHGLEIRDFRYGGARTNYPLTLLAAPGEELPLIVSYDRARFDEATAVRLLGHLRTLLEALGSGSETLLASLSPLTAEERRQVLVDWSGAGEGAQGEGEDVFSRLAAEAELRPDAVAAISDDGHLTYGALRRRAGLLARELRARGAGPEEPVAVLLERGLDLAVAVLGVLEAGAPCLALDPAYPEARRGFMLADARVRVLVTTEFLDRREAISPELPPPPAPDPDALLYVVYTSGSTGTPKGIAMPRRPLDALIAWQLANSEVGRGGLTLQFAALSFDVFFQELLATWCAGGTLLFVTDELRRDPEALARHIEERGVERLFLPYVALRQLAEHGVPSSLREVITAGEALRVTPALRSFFARLPAARLENQYGPAETHVVTAFPLAGPPSAWPAAPPIGRPVGAGRLRLLDRLARAVPAGVAGELCLGGDCLARGYLHRPDLTAERFVPDPFGPPGARLYRTGDLARFLPDGAVEFLGRADGQVKVRGFRVEPGEIEAALARHPGLAQAVVAVREVGGDARLVAWVVPREPGGADPRELRDFLRRTLPDFMIPAAFAVLDALPLTPSGKVDVRALPDPDTAAAPAVRPLTPVEEVLAGLWAEVLGLSAVAPDDDFFALGGHSLLATRVVSRLRRVFAVDLPLRALFEAPVLSALARRIEETRRADRGLAAPPLEPVPRDGDLPLSFAQQRLWLLDRLVPGNPFYNMPGALRLTGPLAPAALERALAELVRRHETLRTTFALSGGEPVQRIAPPASLPVPRIDLGGLSEEARSAELRALAGAEAVRPFDLARGPLVRAALVRLGDDEHALLFTLHHILADGWSLGVFARELGALYAAFAAGRPSPLAELPVQYADFAVWQRRWLTGPVLEEQLAAWKERLRDAPREGLPTDRPRPPVRTYRGGAVRRSLPAALARDLERLARQHGGSLFMTLLAAFDLLLARWGSRDDVVVSTLVANRRAAELEGLIGFFANTLVLRTRLDGAPTFEELLARVREVALEAYTHQDLPFERLIGELEVERGLGRNPLVQTVFILQNAPMAPLELPGLTLSPVDVEVRTARLDLEVHAWAGPEGLQVVFAYDADLFDRSTIEALLDGYAGLLERIAAAPGERISALAASLPVAERSAWEEEPAPAAPNGGEPSTPLEKEVAALFAEVLGREAVGLHDNFFALGGDSLRATQVLIRLEESFGVELPLQALLAAPTVSTLALALLERQQAGGEDLLAELAGLSEEEAERLLLQYQQEAR